MIYNIIEFENLLFRPSQREASVFKISALGPFLKTCVFGSRKRCLHADGTPTRRKIVRF